MVYILTILVILALVVVIGSHRYVIRWQGGKEETICRTFLSVHNARVITPGVPYMVEKQPNRTVIMVDSLASNFEIRVGKKYYKVI